MKVAVPFMAMASVQRQIEVDIPEDTPPDKIRRVAEARAAQVMEACEDLANSEGGWSILQVSREAIYIDNSVSLSFPMSNPDAAADQFRGIIPE